MDPEFLLGKGKIATLLDSKRAAAFVAEPSRLEKVGHWLTSKSEIESSEADEPAMLRGHWHKLLKVWRSHEKDLFESDGSPMSTHAWATPAPAIVFENPESIKNNPQLPKVTAEVFRGFMRAFALQCEAEEAVKPTIDTALPLSLRLFDRAKAMDAGYETQLYTQLAGEYVQAQCHLSERDAALVMGAIIRHATEIFNGHFDGNIRVGAYALTQSQSYSPQR